MGKDIDEDLIEATIRRIQAQSEPDERDPDEGRDDEATANAALQRLQAHVPAPSQGHNPVDAPPEAELEAADDPIEATIRRVQAEAAARASAVDNAAELTEAAGALGPDSSSRESSEDTIEETIRRVQAQAAAMRSDLPSEFAPTPLPPLEADLDDDDGIADNLVEEAIHFAETHAPDLDSEQRRLDEAPPLEATSWPGRDERMLGEPATWEVAAQRLEQGLQDTQREVRGLAAKLEALLPAIERLARGEPLTPRQITIVPPTRKAADESWDESPKVSSMQFGTPPRPAIFRDPSPQTATAEELVEEPAAEPVAPAASAPRLHAVGKGDDLDSRLPRQYRITVEDKRRGVDLVPLHRALQGLDHVKDMSLLSYSNGVAIVSVESVGAIDPEGLRLAVERAMSRQALIEVHNEQTMVVKIQEA